MPNWSNPIADAVALRDRMVQYVVPLRPALTGRAETDAAISIPADLTPAEAEHLAGFLRAVSVAWVDGKGYPAKLIGDAGAVEGSAP